MGTACSINATGRGCPDRSSPCVEASAIFADTVEAGPASTAQCRPNHRHLGLFATHPARHIDTNRCDGAGDIAFLVWRCVVGAHYIKALGKRNQDFDLTMELVTFHVS